MNNKNLIPFFIIFLFCVSIYSNVGSLSYVFDDIPTIVENRFVHKGIGGLREIFSTTLWAGSRTQNAIYSYRPITISTFALEYQIWGLNPSLSHWMQLGLYVVLCYYIFLLFQHLLKDCYTYLPLFIALVFAAHPIHSEVVCNLKSRDELLSLLFSVMSTYYLSTYVSNNNKIHYYLSTGLYFAALLSKETSVCFLGIIPITLYFFYSLSVKEIARYMTGFLLVFGLFMGVRAWILANETLPFVNLTHLQNPLKLAQTFSEQQGTKLYILGKYLQLLVLPYNLTFSYFYNDLPIIGLLDWKALLSLIAYVLLLGYVYYRFPKKDLTAYGIMVYLGGIFLFSHILIPFGDAMGERLVFTASLGYCIAIAYLAYCFLDFSANTFTEFIQKNTINHQRVIALSLVLLTFVLYGFKVYNRTKAWKDIYTLCETDRKISPNSFLINLNLAHFFYLKVLDNPSDKELIRNALHYFKNVSILEPNNVIMWEKHGLMHLLNNDESKATACFQEAIKRTDLLFKSYNKIILTSSLTHEQVEKQWEKVYTQRSDAFYPSIYYLFRQIGMSYFHAKNYEKALVYLQEALKGMQTVHGKAMVYRDLGATYLNMQNYQQAIEYFEEAYKLEPNNYYCNNGLAVCYYQVQQYNEAVTFFENAYRISPNKEIINNLISVYMQLGNNQKLAFYQSELLKVR